MTLGLNGVSSHSVILKGQISGTDENYLYNWYEDIADLRFAADDEVPVVQVGLLLMDESDGSKLYFWPFYEKVPAANVEADAYFFEEEWKRSFPVVDIRITLLDTAIRIVTAVRIPPVSEGSGEWKLFVTGAKR